MLYFCYVVVVPKPIASPGLNAGGDVIDRVGGGVLNA